MNRHRRRADYTSREAVEYEDYPDEQRTDAKILDYAAAEKDLTDPGLMRLNEHLERLVEFRDDGAALLHIPRSKTDQEAEGTVLYIGGAAAEALPAIIPEEGAPDPNIGVFGLSAKQTGLSVDTAGLGDGFTGPNGRVGIAQTWPRPAPSCQPS